MTTAWRRSRSCAAGRRSQGVVTLASPSPIARARRSTELSLVVMAGTITAGAYTLASLGEYAVIPARIIPFLAVLLGLLIVAHCAVRLFARGADATLLPLAALLHGIGYVMITRLDDDLASLQTTWSIVAITVFIITLVVVQRAPDLARYRWVLLFGGLGLLLLPMVPGLGFSAGGARIWVSLGPINFQPGEFAKLALADLLRRLPGRQPRADRRPDVARRPTPPPRAPLPPPDRGRLGRRRRRHGRRARPRVVAAVLHPLRRHAVGRHRAPDLPRRRARDVRRRRVRLVADVRPRADPRLDLARPVGRPARHAATRSSRRCTGSPTAAWPAPASAWAARARCPKPQNDFIFTAIGEEMGLFGATAVLISYLLLIGAGLRVALRTENTFEKLLATGLTTIVGVQAFIIIGGVIKLVPLTGITLPFVSYGGSSLVSNYILLALAHPPQRLGRPPPPRAARRPDAARTLAGLAPPPPRSAARARRRRAMNRASARRGLRASDAGTPRRAPEHVRGACERAQRQRRERATNGLRGRRNATNGLRGRGTP